MRQTNGTCSDSNVSVELTWTPDPDWLEQWAHLWEEHDWNISDFSSQNAAHQEVVKELLGEAQQWGGASLEVRGQQVMNSFKPQHQLHSKQQLLDQSIQLSITLIEDWLL